MADYTVDAKDKILGRVASEVALILQGKKDPNYAPNKVGEDRVFVKNVDKVKFTGNKLKQKKYYRHTGYMGHLKESTLEEEMTKDAEKVFREAVRRMLPKNFLNARRLKNLTFINNG